MGSLRWSGSFPFFAPTSPSGSLLAQGSVPRRERLPFLLTVLILFSTFPLILITSGCSSSPPFNLELSADPNPVPSEFGKVTITARIRGTLPAGVSIHDLNLYATAGTFTPYLIVSSSELVTELRGLTDVTLSPVLIRARLKHAEASLLLTLVSGKLSRLRVDADRSLIIADEGTIRLTVTPLDGAGNPVTISGLAVTLNQGRVESLGSSNGIFRVSITSVTRSDTPLHVTLEAQGIITTSVYPVLSGALHHFSVEILDSELRATLPFRIKMQALDRFGNLRRDFQGFVYFFSYDISTRTPIPVEPATSLLFLGGELTMDGVKILGSGSSLVLRVAELPNGGGASGESLAFSVAPEPARCILLEPSNGKSRVQEATALGSPEGFSVDIMIYSDPCTEVERNPGAPRLMSYTPTVRVYLADGTLWGSSHTPDPNRVGPLETDPLNSRFRIRLYNLTRTSYSPVRVIATIGEIAGEMQLQITPGPWQRVGFDPIPDQWEAGTFEPITGVTITTQPFVATLRALDLYGNTVVTESGTLTCTAPPVDLNPETTATLSLGTLNQPFSLSGLTGTVDLTITCRRSDNPGVLGTSNPFKGIRFPENFRDLVSDFLIVLPGQTFDPRNLNAGVEGDPDPQVAGEPFTVTVVARNLLDPLGCPGPDFKGNLYLGLLTNSSALKVLTSDPILLPSPLTRRMTRTNLPLFCSFLIPVAYSSVTETVVITQAGSNIILVANPLNPPGTRSNIGFPSLSTAFTVLSARFDRLRLVEPIPTPQRVGEPFLLQVEAVDRFGNRISAYDALAGLSDYTRTLSPTSGSFSNGLLSLYVTVSRPLEGDQIFVDTGTPGGRLESNVFDVLATDLVSTFRVSAPSVVSAGVPFPVTITALDTSGNPTSRFSGYRVNLTTESKYPISPQVSDPFLSGWVNQSTLLYRPTTQEMIRVSFRGRDGLSGSITVNPGPPTILKLTPLPSLLIKGQSYEVTAQVYDGAGNLLANYNAPATYYLEKGGVTPGSFNILNGRGSFSFSPGAVASSNRVIVVTGGNPPLTGYSNLFDVISIPHHFALITDGSVIQAYGAFVVTIEARDASDALFPEFLGTVSLSSSLGDPYPATTGSFQSGATTHTLWIRAQNNVTTPVTLTATFTAPDNSQVTGSTSFSLGPKPVLRFVTYPTEVTNGVPFSVSLAVYPDSSTTTPMANFQDQVEFSSQSYFANVLNPPDCIDSPSRVNVSLTPPISPPFTSGSLTTQLTASATGTDDYCIVLEGKLIGNPSPSPDASTQKIYVGVPGGFGR